VSSAVDVVQAWFAAHERGDLDAARSLVAHDVVVHISGESDLSGDVHGFDAFMRWYARRREVLGTTSYRLEDLVGGSHRAVALLRIADGDTEWDQVAVYDVIDEAIVRIRVFEDAPHGR
jgi:ketosteroid isomerase-like protein